MEAANRIAEQAKQEQTEARKATAEALTQVALLQAELEKRRAGD